MIAVDARWVSAYAAGVGETDPSFFAADPVVHPLFPVCVEWDTVRRRRADGVGVHYAHDLVLHRPLAVPMSVSLSLRDGGSSSHRAGRLLTTVIDASATDGPWWTTRMTSLFLGATSADQPAAPPPALVTPVASVDVPIPAGAAHVYTECARIWNPIHTDPAVAAAAGLRGPILHGTATLAMAVSRVMDRAGWTDVARIEGTFGAMVPMPTVLTVGFGAEPGTFDVRLPDGRPAVRGGRVTPRR